MKRSAVGLVVILLLVSVSAVFAARPARCGVSAYTGSPRYAISETATFGIRNGSSETIALPSSAPFWVEDSIGNFVFLPFALDVIMEIPAGGYAEWQVSIGSFTGTPGTYTLFVSYYDSVWNLQTVSKSFRIRK